MITEPHGIDALPLLAGKRILVTGAASGIGLAAARAFMTFGAAVVVSDRDEGSLANQWKDLHADRIRRLDVIDREQYEATVAAAVATMGGLNGVFHSAGVSDVVAPALEVAIEDWQRVVDVSLRGSFLVAQAAGRHMVPTGGGSIVLISSVNGIGGILRRHAYGPAKAAIAQLARTLGSEWGAAGVRVNALAPTYIRTPMIDRLAAEGKVDIGRLERRTPMGRIGETADVARAAAFLLSDLSSFCTGITLPVDGGWLAYGGPGDVSTA